MNKKQVTVFCSFMNTFVDQSLLDGGEVKKMNDFGSKFKLLREAQRFFIYVCILYFLQSLHAFPA